jgi:putative transcriptional regulator
MREKIINHIKEHRTNRGITQEQLAKVLGVSRQTIISIERGHYIPSLQLALKISEFFNCPTDEMFTRKENV